MLAIQSFEVKLNSLHLLILPSYQMFVILFLSLCVCLLLLTLWDNYSSTNLPPGPFRLPFFGSVLSVLPSSRRPPIVALKKATEKYGPVVYMMVGSRPAIIIGELETAKFVFKNELWQGRPYHEILDYKAGGPDLGLICGNGPGWKEMRRFTLRNLRDVGNLTNVNRTMEEGLQSLVERLDAVTNESRPVVQIRHFFKWPVIHNMYSLLYSAKTPEEEAKRLELVPILETYSDACSMCGSVLDVFPWLRHIAPQLSGFTFMNDIFKQYAVFFKDLLETRRREYVDPEHKRDCIDAFVEKMIKNEETGGTDPVLKHYTFNQFLGTFIDMFFGGAETTINALEFAIYFVSRHPKAQKRVQEEIDRVVGRKRFPTMEDKAMMPYTEAVLTEVNRMANTLPMSPRQPAEDTTLNGYFVKKGTATIINLYSVHMNAKTFGDPYTFRPERFMADDDKELNPEMMSKVVSFGGGSRWCIAETWARSTLFIYLTGLLQNHSFEFISTNRPFKDNHDIDDVSLSKFSDPDAVLFPNRFKVGFTLHPQPFEVKVTRR